LYNSEEEVEPEPKTIKTLLKFEREPKFISFDFYLINHCFAASARLRSLLNDGTNDVHIDSAITTNEHINKNGANDAHVDLPPNGWHEGCLPPGWCGVRRPLGECSRGALLRLYTKLQCAAAVVLSVTASGIVWQSRSLAAAARASTAAKSVTTLPTVECQNRRHVDAAIAAVVGIGQRTQSVSIEQHLNRYLNILILFERQ
jgi:hypothetical protein